jgi:hypothetical protein
MASVHAPGITIVAIHLHVTYHVYVVHGRCIRYNRTEKCCDRLQGQSKVRTTGRRRVSAVTNVAATITSTTSTGNTSLSPSSATITVDQMTTNDGSCLYLDSPSPSSVAPASVASLFHERSSSRSPVRKQHRRTPPNDATSPSLSTTTSMTLSSSSTPTMTGPSSLWMSPHVIVSPSQGVRVWEESYVIRTALGRCLIPWIIEHMSTYYHHKATPTWYGWVDKVMKAPVPRVCPSCTSLSHRCISCQSFVPGTPSPLPPPPPSSSSSSDTLSLATTTTPPTTASSSSTSSHQMRQFGETFALQLLATMWLPKSIHNSHSLGTHCQISVIV